METDRDLPSLKDACIAVEQASRDFGEDVEILITKDGVQISLLSQDDPIFAPNLFRALSKLRDHVNNKTEVLGQEVEPLEKVEIDHFYTEEDLQPYKAEEEVDHFYDKIPDESDWREVGNCEFTIELLKHPWRVSEGISTYGKPVWYVHKFDETDEEWKKLTKVHWSGEVLKQARCWRTLDNAKKFVLDQIGKP